MRRRSRDEFTDFYEATWSRTLTCVYGLTRDLGVSEEIAQEAYARAWARWATVASHDEPVAWVRRVATNLALSRWRRHKTASTWLSRQRPDDPTFPLDESRVALIDALQRLPDPQRRAIVLHHIGDLSVADVAHIEGCAVGTIKARLSRGRLALRELLADTSQNGEPIHA